MGPRMCGPGPAFFWVLTACIALVDAVSSGARGGQNLGSSGLLKRRVGLNNQQRFSAGVGPGGAASKRGFPIGVGPDGTASQQRGFPVGVGPDGVPSSNAGHRRQLQGFPEGVGPETISGHNLNFPRSLGQNGPSLPDHQAGKIQEASTAAGMLDAQGQAGPYQKSNALGNEHIVHAEAQKSDTTSAQQAEVKSSAQMRPDSEFGLPRRAPTRLARVNPDGDELTSQTVAPSGWTGGNGIGYVIDPHGKKYKTIKVKDFISAQMPTKPKANSILLEGDTHYEPAIQERLYHYRVQNTGDDGTVEMVTVTATLPEGSKAHHMYWIRNRRGLKRPEHHECYAKRLTVTCNIHKLESGQLSTIYIHAKERLSGHGPMHASAMVGSKIISTVTLGAES